MKKLLITIFLMGGIILIGCTNNKITNDITSNSSTSINTITSSDLTKEITYYYNNQIIEKKEVKSNDTIIDIKHFINQKSFKGYYFDEDLTEKIDIDTYKVQDNISVYLKYTEKKTYNILYVPLDNRPINKERVELLSKSVSVNLILPDEDLYRTYLDNQLTNSNGTKIGDPEKLLDFIKKQNHSTIDGYIISLDQMTSGGLVGSRANYDPNINDEIKIIEELIKIIKDKPLYLIDTVMRLASTSGFDGYTSTEYEGLRKYGMTARPLLSKDTLTLDNIKANYTKNTSLQTITLPAGITDQMKEDYLTARFRKISLTSKILSLINLKSTYYICGIDDSSNGNNIQSNEINYIKKLFPEVNLFPGTDELGLMCLSKFYMDQTNYKPLTAKITFYGNTQNKPDTTYDGLTFKENIESHLKSLNVNITTSNKFDFEILALTSETTSTYANKLKNHLQVNLNKDVPTTVIDGNSINFEKRKILPQYLLTVDNLGKLLGYSSWNTAGNTIGISLSMITSRLSYLNSDNSCYNDNSTENFVNMLVFALVKDITYKAFVGNIMSSYINSNAKDQNGNIVKTANSNFYQYINYSPDFNLELSKQMTTFNNYNTNRIISILSDSLVYSSLYNEQSTKIVDTLEINNFIFPWYRHFEITFNVTTVLKK